MIENCCNNDSGNSIIKKGDPDEILVYFLAFKLHCFKGESEEALDMFS
jgi:hypothetical protein